MKIGHDFAHKKQRENSPIKTLRDAYKLRGFRVLAKPDGYDLEPPVLVLTLNRRAKKPCARLRENLPKPL